MFTSEKKHRKKAISIIQEALIDNNSMNWILKKDKKRDDRLVVLAEYLFDSGMARKGVYLSEDTEAIAICCQKSNKINFFKKTYLQLKLICFGIGFSKIIMVMKRQRQLHSFKPKTDYLYFWLFAASDAGKGTKSTYELQKGIYKLSKDRNLPIYLETSIRKNRVVYERYGFDVYHTWKIDDQEFDMWFMRRNPV
jgi:hypothetical protein